MITSTQCPQCLCRNYTERPIPHNDGTRNVYLERICLECRFRWEVKVEIR